MINKKLTEKQKKRLSNIHQSAFWMVFLLIVIGTYNKGYLGLVLLFIVSASFIFYNIIKSLKN